MATAHIVSQITMNAAARITNGDNSVTTKEAKYGCRPYENLESYRPGNQNLIVEIDKTQQATDNPSNVTIMVV